MTTSAAKRLAKIARGEDGFSNVLRRWAATWIDLVILGAVLATEFFVLPIAGGLISGLSAGRGAMPAGLAGVIGLLAVMVMLVTLIAYYVVLEGRWGRTVGKLVTGITVVDESGRPPGMGKALIRTLFRIIEVNPLLVGGLPAGIIVLFSKEHRRLGDMAANTYVLPVKVVDQFNRQDSEDPLVFS